MTRREADLPTDDYRDRRRPVPPPPVPSASWTQFILTGLVAVAVAWGGMSFRMTSVEERAKEDRLLLREAIESLRSEVVKLRDDLQTEREQRLTDRSHEAQRVVPSITFPHGKAFDK